jgi:cobalt-zinc-cadmium efflux system outer membrane protein
MLRQHWRALVPLLIPALFAGRASAQQALTWEQVRERFRTNNPNLMASRIAIDESKATEVTAGLRPNPDFSSTLDQIDPFTTDPYRPLGNVLPLVSGSYLHERRHKRELRRESAQNATAIATSQEADLERTLLFTLHNAFVQTLQAKAVLQNAKENLAYWDHQLSVNRDRFQAGDMAKVDLSRLELQRVQYESDFQTADVNLRTAKIQILTLLNDRTPISQFDVTGSFDFTETIPPLEEVRNAALDSRPDLRAQMQTVEKAKTDHRLAIANGSTDPTFGMDMGRNPPIPAYFGVSVTIPLRIFDRNQGEKLRTQLDIGRNERLLDASRAQVFSDVDSAYATLMSTLNLLRPYKSKYLPTALEVRDIVSFSYQRGGASLLEYLDAQKSYRDVRLNYLNLVGSFLTAANQLNEATGQEVLP